MPKKELTSSAITDMIDERIIKLRNEVAERERIIKELMDLKWDILTVFR